MIGQQQQSFAVGVEPTRRVYVGYTNEIRQRRVCALAGKLADDPEGLVEREDSDALRHTADTIGWRAWPAISVILGP